MLNYVIGPLLFIVLSYTIYERIQNQPNLKQSWQLILQSYQNSGRWLIFCLISLMLVNWGIEAKKWQLLIKPIEPVSYLRAFRAVLSGVSFSLFIPTGDYVGKILYMHEGNRLRSIPQSAAGSMSQLIITLFAGLISLIYLRLYVLEPKMQLVGLSVFWLDALMYVIASGLIVLLVIYYKLSWIATLLEKIPFIYKYRIFIQGLENFYTKDLTRILMLSLCRFIVFIVQYLLALHIFNVNINWFDAVPATCVLFLVLALIPTVTIAELGIRGEVSIQLFGLLSANTLGIAATAALIWVINLIIPALAGSLFILGIKLFGNNQK
ncbi:MAG: lysylphosphatidylglycerol synthase domain-containing protein [Chitinophagaceae bacterium]